MIKESSHRQARIDRFGDAPLMLLEKAAEQRIFGVLNDMNSG